MDITNAETAAQFVRAWDRDFPFPSLTRQRKVMLRTIEALERCAAIDRTYKRSDAAMQDALEVLRARVIEIDRLIGLGPPLANGATVA